MSITGDFDELDRAIAELEQLGAVGRDAGKVAAPALEHVARAQWAAGQAPDGAAWAKTRDGRIALVPLTSRIKVSGAGDTVRMEGPEELDFHQRTRPVAPPMGDPLPDPWAEALARAFDAAAKKR